MVMMLSSILLVAGGWQAAGSPTMPVYRTANDIELYRWFDDKSGVVLASFDTSNGLPAWAPMTVVIGHGPESAALAVLAPRVERFFNENASNDERMGFVQEQRVSYVIHGPRERQLGDWDPSSWDCLVPVQQFGDAVIYETCLTP